MNTVDVANQCCTGRRGQVVVASRASTYVRTITAISKARGLVRVHATHHLRPQHRHTCCMGDINNSEMALGTSRSRLESRSKSCCTSFWLLHAHCNCLRSWAAILRSAFGLTYLANSIQISICSSLFPLFNIAKSTDDPCYPRGGETLFFSLPIYKFRLQFVDR